MWNYKLLPTSPLPLLETAPFKVWTIPDGTPCVEFYRTSSGFLMRFPDIADYRLPADGEEITCSPCPGIPDATLEHLYHNQVRPLALSERGRFTFHASAVTMEDGAIAFLAESGGGKSTLATAFARNGQPFLTDDALLLEEGGGRMYAQPGLPSVRLWEDSERALIREGAPRTESVHYTTKTRFVSGPEMDFCQSPRELNAAYFLGPGNAIKIEIRPINATAAIALWLQHAYILDAESRDKMRTHFIGVADIVNVVPTFALDYPRRYKNLPGVCDAVRNHVSRIVNLS